MFIAHLPPAFAYVYNWVNEFKRGHISICDAPRSGFQLRLLHQKSSIKSTILFWLIDEWKCASLLRPDISHGTVISILHEKLGVKKLSARWVPRLLTVDRATVWRFQNNVWRCFNVILMNFCVDSLLWTKHGSITSHPRWRNSQNNRLHRVNQPKKVKIVKSAGKVMATVFWDSRRIIHINYLPSKQMINGDYYAVLLDRFNNILKKKHLYLAKKKVLFHQATHRFTRARHRWPNSTNYATNCFPIQHIRQI